MLKPFLEGAETLAAWAIALFFVRFRKATRDRLFAFFAAAFFLLGFERIALVFLSSELKEHVYLIRLVAFFLILIGILNKNRE